ncbi:hypothetical protein P154DRAFT_237590 [Amniculicola lignicola CBS 123094]|uniref:MYND-type domain-containing protein n=1 Tax=Amniculicola lignicola CBS 123094 TaxID=1392246 RepID=A0A6A5WDV4_9PLEO|nr:hypothetical protein P154DRAFT_237590 [Amniculicola lignicola CBS 123094]
MAGRCSTCKKSESEVPGGLKRCAKCKIATYCSVECQKAVWKVHKKVCGKTEHCATFAHPVSKNLEFHVPNPFTRLDNMTYLHERPKQDVFKLLIDSFRMRQDDQYKYGGDISANSIYDGSSSSVSGFRKFLKEASTKEKLLPTWWTTEKQKECEQYAMKEDNWSNVKSAVEKQDVIDHYGDAKMPMQLRMFSDCVCGIAPWAADGKGMRQMMMMMENGEGGDGVMSMMSL